jgi:hypothetical protein
MLHRKQGAKVLAIAATAVLTLGAAPAQRALFAALPARKGIDRIGDSFELCCELPRFVQRKHRVRTVEIDMHPVIKSKDRTSGDERDARFGLQIAGRHEIFFNNFPLSPKAGKF